MIIKHFDIENGLYVFEEKNLTTQYHAHPILELVIARQGCFSVSTKEKKLENIEFCLIKPHQLHAFEGENSAFEFIFIEANPLVVDEIFELFGVQGNTDGIITIKRDFKNRFSVEILKRICNSQQKTYDKRISNSLNFIRSHIHHSKIPLMTIAQHVHLSPSRLSHLFREQMGISIQKYIVWERMKTTINLVIQNDLNLTEATYSSGFYDVPHFTKNFKDLFGVKPSTVYNNSRIVQV